MKVLYRVSKANDDHNEEIAEHCGLFGYSCSQYLTEKLEVDDPYYLLYIYYSGLSCLKIMPYIEDEDVCKELCHKELERWKVLDGRDMSLYEKEEKSFEIIMEVKKSLANYID